MGGPLAVFSRLLGDVRSIDELLYRGIIDLQLHVHRQSLLFTELARALLPGGAGIQSALLLALAIRVAASVFSMAMAALDAHLVDIAAEASPRASRLTARRRAGQSAVRVFKVGMALLEDDDFDADMLEEEEEDYMAED
jgi:hypothetical protein